MARDRWSSRTTFILGAVGSAVGLGNLWRFPFLVFRWGGGTFLIPYFICLFFFGVPLLLMEVTLGRQFQGGDPVCFASMHPRLIGIGWMSAFGSFLLAVYYPVLIAWIVVFFFNSFQDPLPWALGEGNGTDSLGGAIDFFVGVIDDSGDIAVTDGLNPILPLALLFVWACVFFSIFKGVSVVSKVVQVSVPLPIATLIILLANSVGKPGASDGIEAYIGNWDLTVLGDAQIWQAAVGQVFFSIGVCFGIMTAYSSYMESRKGLVTDAFMIAVLDSGISFFAGFVVFTAIGVLANDLGLTFQDEGFTALISGGRLVFIAYPAALDGLDNAPQVFSLIFFLTLFFLALDSAFSIVEAVVAAIHDTNYAQEFKREYVTLAVCIPGFVFGIFFTLDNGSYWLDLIDYYLNTYIMQALGALECMATMWVFGFEDSAKDLGNKSLLAFSGLYLVGAFAAPLGFILVPYWNIEVGFCLWAFFTVLSFVAAYALSPPQHGKGYKIMFSGGAQKLMEIMAIDEFNDLSRMTYRFSALLHVWCIMCKYLIPVFLIMLMITGAAINFDEPAFGFPQAIQNIGNFVVVVAWMIFFFFLFVKVEAYSNKADEFRERQAALKDVVVEEDKAEEVKELDVPLPVETEELEEVKQEV